MIKCKGLLQDYEEERQGHRIMDIPSLAHIGWAVQSIEQALPAFEALGFFSAGNVTEDSPRKVRILLLSDTKGNIIELVEPMDTESPVSLLLKKTGAAPYHVCFSASNSEWISLRKKLRRAGFFEFTAAAPAPALGGNEVFFLYSRHVGLIEIVLTESIPCGEIPPPVNKI